MICNIVYMFVIHVSVVSEFSVKLTIKKTVEIKWHHGEITLY